MTIERQKAQIRSLDYQVSSQALEISLLEKASASWQQKYIVAMEKERAEKQVLEIQKQYYKDQNRKINRNMLVSGLAVLAVLLIFK